MMEWLKTWMPVFILSFQLLLGLGLWALNQKFVSKKDCHRYRGLVDGKTITMEKKFTTIPTNSEIQELRRDLGELSKELGETQGHLKGLTRAVDLMNEYLLNHGIK